MKCKWGVTWSGVTGSHRGSKKNKLEIYNNNLYGVACKSRVCETSLFLQKIFQKGNSFDREAKWWKNAGVFFFILFSSLENLWKYPAGSVCVCGGGGGTFKIYNAEMSDGKYFLRWEGILFCGERVKTKCCSAHPRINK